MPENCKKYIFFIKNMPRIDFPTIIHALVKFETNESKSKTQSNSCDNNSERKMSLKFYLLT